MRLVVWNSQGSKWDTAWTDFTSQYVTAPPTDDVLLLLVEAGWAPWVKSGDVVINNGYPLTTGVEYFDEIAAGKSSLCQSVLPTRRNSALWVPWVGNLDAMKTNSRCSLGTAFYPDKLMFDSVCTTKMENFIRPVIRIRLAAGSSVNLSVFVVHMVSGSSAKAEAQLVNVMNKMHTLVPEGSAAIIVGDMNVDLLSAGKMSNLPSHWSIVRTGVATQQSGGELDYGLLFDPNSTYASASASVLQKYKTGNNQSDHSVLSYSLPTS